MRGEGHCSRVVTATTYDAVLAPWSRKYCSGHGGGDEKLVGGGEVKSLEVLHQLRHGYRRPVQYRLSFRDDDVSKSLVPVARMVSIAI
jgi:hypothetical protein